MKIVIIPARGGSRRVPRKNIRNFAGKPMLLYPIEAARSSGLFDLIVVSTDDYEIATIAFQAGAVVMPRPQDDGATGTQEIAARVLDQLEATGSLACVVYPCTPLIQPQDFRDVQARLLRPDAKCFVRTVYPDGRDAGALYMGWIRAFRDRKPLDDFNTAAHPLPAGRVCDIDTGADWSRAQQLFNAMLNERGNL